MNIQVDFNPQGIMQKLGLDASGTARKVLAANVRRRCDKYVPMDTGLLKNNAQISGDGSSITYLQPYATRQYTIPYRHRDPLRGREWDKRMLANESGQLIREIETDLKGRLK